MLIKHKVLIILVMLLAANVHSYAGDIIRVGLLSLDNTLSLTVAVCEGEYEIVAGGQSIVLNHNDNVLINKAGNRILVSTMLNNTMLVDSVVLQAADRAAYFSIRNNFRPVAPRQYCGDLIVKPDIDALLAINEVEADSYSAGEFSYPFTRLREDWGLKSSFFSVSLGDGTVILKGRGYGHGVGLCQEGSMVMAERGLKMEEIIGFYFHDLHILNINDARPLVEINSAF
ncbi:MAG: hypothetical protein U9N72_00950 [Bacteroidota bacterium]|nr:hypothetical protein [Bacteroidota bacterium]